MKYNRFIKGFTAVLLMLAMLVYTAPMSIQAMTLQEDVTMDAGYTLHVYIPKNTVGRIDFYPTLGFDENNCDFFDTADACAYVMDSASDSKYDIYTMSCAEGTYSFRATDTEHKSLGGGVIKVPAEAAVDSGEEESREISAYLKLCHAYITNQYDDKKADAEDFSVVLTNQFGAVSMGEATVDERGNSCYPALVYANGNALLYYATFTPSEEYGKQHQLTQTQLKNIAVFKGDKIQNIKTALSEAVPFTIIAPSGAEVAMFEQKFNFNTTKTEPVSVTDNGDATSSFLFSYPGTSYRVSLDGYRTQAGYIPHNISEEESTLEAVFSDASAEERTDGGIGRKESGVLLNINERNKLSLDVGETYKVRAYRAPWQIINTDTDNIMIEPDFHFQILAGTDVIDIRQSDGGNAGGNWAEITALGDGVAIVEVTYDAIDVSWGETVETYGATNPGRSGVFAVAVGNAYADVPGIDLDCEYHTQYFTGDNGILTITPEGDDVRVEVANVWQGTLRMWKNIVGSHGSFEVPVANGNNILKITADGVTDYRIIRGSKLEPVITNHTAPERTQAVCPGDELTIGFKGLFQWIPKFSGIYNPSSLYARYELNQETVESAKSQYDLPETTLDITVPADAAGSITLSNGRLTGNSLGSVWSAHRQLTDNGVPANFNASNLALEDLALPDLTIPVAEPSGGSPDAGNTGGFGGGPGGDDGGGDFYEPDSGSIDASNVTFDISDSEADGYVTISFTDNGKRKSGESGVTYKTPLGEIIEAVEVPFQEGDTLAAVTLRLLKALGIKASYTGKPTNNFYLSSIGNFTLNGKYYASFGEFDAGAASGWMIRHNNWFVNMGASEFEVQDGDTVEWLYTCRLGADIGCDWSNPSAEITGIQFRSNYGTLSPAFENHIAEYTYFVSDSLKSISLRAELENYWARVTYQSGGKEYKPMESIPVSDGTVITMESAFSEYMGHTPTDTDSVKITVRKNAGGPDYSGGGAGALGNIETASGQEENTAEDSNQENEKPAFSETTFSDVTQDDWHYESVKYVYERNLMQGTGNGFEPESKLSRAMLVTVLYRMAKPERSANTHGFSDVPDGKWYSDAVQWAASNGIVNGITSTEFAPDSDISREQLALIFYRFATMQGLNTEDKADILSFADTVDISDWAMDAMKWAKKAALVNGTSETTLSPKKTATRAQVAAILMRFCENAAK